MIGAFPVLRSEVVTLSPPLPPPEPPIPATQFFYYWNLNEAVAMPSNWYDAYKNEPLTGNSIGGFRVPSVSYGKIGRCAEFSTVSATALHLSLGYNVISWAQSNSINLWFRLTSLPPINSWISHIFSSQSYGKPFSCSVSTTKIELLTTMQGGGTAVSTINWTADLNWHMLTLIYTASPRQVAIGLDMGNLITTALPNALDNASAGSIYFGANNSNGSMNGLIDLLGIFPYALNAGQRSFLWNSGNGREYPW